MERRVLEGLLETFRRGYRHFRSIHDDAFYSARKTSSGMLVSKLHDDSPETL
jgi:hypothetical protein